MESQEINDDSAPGYELELEYIDFPPVVTLDETFEVVCKITRANGDPQEGSEVEWQIMDGAASGTLHMRTDAQGLARTMLIPEEKGTLLLRAKATYGEAQSRWGSAQTNVVERIDDRIVAWTPDPPDESLAVEAGADALQRTFSVTVEPRRAGVDVEWSLDGGAVQRQKTSAEGISLWTISVPVGDKDVVHTIVAACGTGLRSKAEFVIGLSVHKQIVFTAHEPPGDRVVHIVPRKSEPVRQDFVVHIDPPVADVEVSCHVDGLLVAIVRTDARGMAGWDYEFGADDTNPIYHVLMTCGRSEKARIAQSVSVVSNFAFSAHTPIPEDERFLAIGHIDPVERMFTVTVDPPMEGVVVDWKVDGLLVESVKTDSQGVSLWNHAFDIGDGNKKFVIQGQCGDALQDYYLDLVTHMEIVSREPVDDMVYPANNWGGVLTQGFMVIVDPTVPGTAIKWIVDGELLDTTPICEDGRAEWTHDFNVESKNKTYEIEARIALPSVAGTALAASAEGESPVAGMIDNGLATTWKMTLVSEFEVMSTQPPIGTIWLNGRFPDEEGRTEIVVFLIKILPAMVGVPVSWFVNDRLIDVVETDKNGFAAWSRVADLNVWGTSDSVRAEVVPNDRGRAAYTLAIRAPRLTFNITPDLSSGQDFFEGIREGFLLRRGGRGRLRVNARYLRDGMEPRIASNMHCHAELLRGNEDHRIEGAYFLTNLDGEGYFDIVSLISLPYAESQFLIQVSAEHGKQEFEAYSAPILPVDDLCAYTEPNSFGDFISVPVASGPGTPGEVSCPSRHILSMGGFKGAVDYYYRKGGWLKATWGFRPFVPSLVLECHGSPYLVSEGKVVERWVLEVLTGRAPDAQ